MANGDGPQIGLPGGQSVPMPGTGNDPLGGNSGQIDIQQLLQKIMAQSGQQHSKLPQPGMGAQIGLQRSAQRTPMAEGPFQNKNEGVQGFLHNVGAAVQNAVKAHKEKQITTAMNDWSVLQQSWENAQTIAQQSGQDPQQIFQKLPGVKAIMEDPKKMKNMAKSLQMDWLNPEKTTVYQEAAKRHVEQDKQGKMMKFFKSMMGKGGPQLNQQQKQQMGQEEAQKMGAMASPQAADPKVLIEVAKVAEQQQASILKAQTEAYKALAEAQGRMAQAKSVQDRTQAMRDMKAAELKVKQLEGARNRANRISVAAAAQQSKQKNSMIIDLGTGKTTDGEDIDTKDTVDWSDTWDDGPPEE